MGLTPQQFVEKWANTELSERASYQAHFMDVCQLVDYETPSGTGKNSADDDYAFEYGIKKLSGSQGFADVFLQKHFAVEYKAPQKYRDLRAAYDQLLQYREQLQNPPLLVVTDIQHWEIHTNWSNTEKKVYSFTHEEIATRPTVLNILRNLFHDPAKLHPRRNTEQVTTDAATVFKLIADNMRNWEAEPERIAHFLTKIVFCLFAEDVSLLPGGARGEAGIFSEIIEQNRQQPEQFVETTQYLFHAMANGTKIPFVNIPIPYFNGSLFDDVKVELLSLEALSALERAARLNWESIEPAIFGTLFERSLDPAKRSQLGAHYTSREDILLIVEPVLMRPFEREWQRIQTEAEPIRAKYDDALASSNRRNQTTYANQLMELRETMLRQLRDVKVLDPACGSGNFLYVALQRLMDMEKAVIKAPVFSGLTEPMPEVHPRQMYGIEKDPIAHALASIVVWIGYLQWRRSNGYTAFKEPILEDLHENIVCKDAILEYAPSPKTDAPLHVPTANEFVGTSKGMSTADNKPTEPDWQSVDVIIGNPPFLGGSRILGELGEQYQRDIWAVYKDRVPGFADLVCYWFERARTQIEQGKAKRVGLLATNSIRGGVNREVLHRIKQTGDIFMAWADRPWVLEGAAVRVSMVGFDDGSEQEKTLDGQPVGNINPDLTGSVDITKAKRLNENNNLAFMGILRNGSFDIDANAAHKLLNEKNPSGLSNSDVVKPWMNGSDIVQQYRNKWIIDFGHDTTLDEAEKYNAPFQYVKAQVYPARIKKTDEKLRTQWWIYERTRPEMRNLISPLKRFIVTPTLSKHRLFIWLDKNVVPDKQLIAITRDDDYFFGILHSKFHEVWSLRRGTSLGETPRYTPTTTFETFPFPFVPGEEDTTSAAYQAISAAAKQLHEERDAWLNRTSPPNPLSAGSEGESGVRKTGKNLQDRTLTNLYNALNVFRGKESIRTKQAAADFAPRLSELHDALDKAVCDAYGFAHSILEDEEAILRCLLALNLERANTPSDKPDV